MRIISVLKRKIGQDLSRWGLVPGKILNREDNNQNYVPPTIFIPIPSIINISIPGL